MTDGREDNANCCTDCGGCQFYCSRNQRFGCYDKYFGDGYFAYMTTITLTIPPGAATRFIAFAMELRAECEIGAFYELEIDGGVQVDPTDIMVLNSRSGPNANWVGGDHEWWGTDWRDNPHFWKWSQFAEGYHYVKIYVRRGGYACGGCNMYYGWYELAFCGDLPCSCP